jgi:hypothetical protein
MIRLNSKCESSISESSGQSRLKVGLYEAFLAAGSEISSTRLSGGLLN